MFKNNSEKEPLKESNLNSKFFKVKGSYEEIKGSNYPDKEINAASEANEHCPESEILYQQQIISSETVKTPGLS